MHTLKELLLTVAILVLETPFLTKMMCFCVCVHVFLFFEQPPYFLSQGRFARSAQLFLITFQCGILKFQRRSLNGGQSQRAKEWEVEGSQCQGGGTNVCVDVSAVVQAKPSRFSPCQHFHIGRLFTIFRRRSLR